MSSLGFVPMAATGEALKVVDEAQNVIDLVAKEQIGVVQVADQLEKIFREKGLLYEMDIHCRQVGFDPSNRDATGGNAQEAHLLASDIALVGFSFRETSHAICIEVEPGDKTVEEFNRIMSNNVDLAPVEPDSIRFGSLACGHTNYGLRCMAASVPSSDPMLSEEFGPKLHDLRNKL